MRYILVILLSVFMFSCSARDNAKPLAMNMQESRPQTDMINNSSESVQKPLAEPVITPGYQGDYIIGPEDLLEINVYQVDELKKTIRVSSSGYIHLPLTGQIKASGLTASELETEIGNHYQKYLQEPLVSIFIKEYRSQKITVLGAVKNPKVHTVTNQNYLLDMLTLSGGLSDKAGEICYVRRGSGTIVINLDELLINGNTALNIPIFAGDIIHCPVGGILFVDGAVNSPGSFPLKGDLTITQAISMARGFNTVATRNDIKIYRDNGKEKRDVIPVNYDAILAQKAPDIILKDRDILIVPSSAIKEFIQSISGATRIGKFSVSGGL